MTSGGLLICQLDSWGKAFKIEGTAWQLLRSKKEQGAFIGAGCSRLGYKARQAWAGPDSPCETDNNV